MGGERSNAGFSIFQSRMAQGQDEPRRVGTAGAAKSLHGGFYQTRRAPQGEYAAPAARQCEAGSEENRRLARPAKRRAFESPISRLFCAAVKPLQGP